MRTLKAIFSMVILGSTFLLSSFIQKENNSFEGNWIAKDLANSTIEVTKNGKDYWQGKITASDDKSIIGRKVFDKIKSDGKGNWVGKLTDPIKEMDVNATFHLDNANTLKLVGKKFFFTKTYYWIRK
jgi:uncharacterized protein (DUF2147 family)